VQGGKKKDLKRFAERGERKDVRLENASLKEMRGKMRDFRTLR
jgi:hypothetical protein